MDPTGPTGPLEEEEHACFQDLPFELQLSVAHFLDNDTHTALRPSWPPSPLFTSKPSAVGTIGKTSRCLRSRCGSRPRRGLSSTNACCENMPTTLKPMRPTLNGCGVSTLRRASLRLEAEEQRFTSDGQIHAVRWTLCNDEGNRAPVRVERLVLGERFVLGALGADSVTYFEGGMGAEPLRKTRVQYVWQGVEEFYCRSTQRKLRTEIGDGTVIHFEGAPRKLGHKNQLTRIWSGLCASSGATVPGSRGSVLSVFLSGVLAHRARVERTREGLWSRRMSATVVWSALYRVCWAGDHERARCACVVKFEVPTRRNNIRLSRPITCAPTSSSWNLFHLADDLGYNDFCAKATRPRRRHHQMVARRAARADAEHTRCADWHYCDGSWHQKPSMPT